MDCPRCGAPNLEGAAYCASCGSALGGDAPRPPVEQPPPTTGQGGEGSPWKEAHDIPAPGAPGPYGPTPVPPAGPGTGAPFRTGFGAAGPAGLGGPGEAGGYGAPGGGQGGGHAGGTPYGQPPYGQPPYGSPPYGQPPYGAPQQSYAQPFGGSQFGRQMYPGPRPNVPNYLVWSILATLFCCLPAGVVSIVYAAQVNGKLDEGDYSAAQRYSSNARTWAMVSAGLALVGVIVYVLLIMVFGVFSSTTTY